MGTLSSQLFQGDVALNNCLNSDPAHVTPGPPAAVGEHVSKIQDALFLLLHDAVIDHSEIKEKRYGRTTADAVLAYKRKFDIVNRSYQAIADNIVGKMTIAKLDKDLLAKEAEFPEMIASARVGAFLRCQTAHQRMVGLGPPAPSPTRVDPNDVFKQRALESARAIFDQADLELGDMDNDAPIPITVGKMKNILANSSLPTVSVPSSDPRSNLRAAFVVDSKLPIFLCPQFFATTDEQRVRTFIHEAAHLARIGDPAGEAYYSRYNCRNEPPDIMIGDPRSLRRADQADTWAKFVNCISGQPPDKDDADVIHR